MAGKVHHDDAELVALVDADLVLDRAVVAALRVQAPGRKEE
jgi:hypothetical protein